MREYAASTQHASGAATKRQEQGGDGRARDQREREGGGGEGMKNGGIKMGKGGHWRVG